MGFYEYVGWDEKGRVSRKGDRPAMGVATVTRNGFRSPLARGIVTSGGSQGKSPLIQSPELFVPGSCKGFGLRRLPSSRALKPVSLLRQGAGAFPFSTLGDRVSTGRLHLLRFGPFGQSLPGAAGLCGWVPSWAPTQRGSDPARRPTVPLAAMCCSRCRIPGMSGP